MKRILIAYDGSPCSDEMLEDLLHAGLPAELDVTVVCVADVWLPPDPDLAESPLPDQITKSVRKGRAMALEEVATSHALAESACGRLKKRFPKWRVYPRAFADSPSWGIVKEAGACKSDLIILGSHGRSAFGRFWLGSVAQKVAAEAYCSVRIARCGNKSVNSLPRMLVAVDGSEDSQAAALAVALRPWPYETEFRVVAVVDPKLETAAVWPAVDAHLWMPGKGKRPDDWVGSMVEHFAQKLRDAGLKVQTDIFEGDPKQVLLREAETWQADCIFLGARGLNHGQRVFLGSCASAVAARASCSVEIVRP